MFSFLGAPVPELPDVALDPKVLAAASGVYSMPPVVFQSCGLSDAAVTGFAKTTPSNSPSMLGFARLMSEIRHEPNTKTPHPTRDVMSPATAPSS